MGDKYPYVHETATDFVTQSTAARENKQGEALANLINSLPVFKVDPDNAECYATVNAAYASADANLPAGAAIVIELAPGKTHTLSGTLTLAASRDSYFTSEVRAEDKDSSGPNTKLSGTITCPSAAAQPRRRLLVFQNLTVTGTVNGNAYWALRFEASCVGCVINRTHTIGYPAGGCWVYINNCNNNIQMLKIVDSDTAFMGAWAQVFVEDSYIGTAASTTGIQFVGAGSVQFRHCSISISSATAKLVDFNSQAGSNVSFDGCSIQVSDSGTLVGGIGATTRIDWYGDNGITQYTTKALTIGTPTSTSRGVPHVIGDTVPLSPPAGTIWTNPSMQRTATYVYHASYPYWKWADWKLGEAFVLASTGDATASTGGFGTVNQAVSALDAAETAGNSLYIILSAAAHTLAGSAITMPSGRNIYIRAMQGDFRGSESRDITSLTGAITMPSNEALRKYLVMEGFKHVGNINLNPRSNLKLTHLYLSGVINRTNGDYGCDVHGDDVTTEASTFRVVDADGGTVGSITFRNSILGCNTYSTFVFVGDGVLLCDNCIISTWVMTVGTKYLVEFNNGYGVASFQQCTFNINLFNATYSFAMYKDSANATAQYHGVRAQAPGTGTFDLSCGTVSEPDIDVLAKIAPSNPFAGLRWMDNTLKEELVWDGTYWRAGSMIRRDVRVNVGSASAFVSAGVSVPSGAVALSAQLNLDKAITGAAGANRLALVDTTGSVNIWACTSALTKNSKANEEFAPLVRSVGDDLYLAAMSGLVPGGTIAGSGASDVRVLVRYRNSIQLPNA